MEQEISIDGVILDEDDHWSLQDISDHNRPLVADNRSSVKNTKPGQ